MRDLRTLGRSAMKKKKNRRKHKTGTLLWRIIKGKAKRLWRWLRREVLTPRMIIWLLIAECVFWSPAIVTGLLALTVSEAWWAAFSAYIAFWTAVPFTPAIPAQVALAYALKKLCEWLWAKITGRHMRPPRKEKGEKRKEP